MPYHYFHLDFYCVRIRPKSSSNRLEGDESEKGTESSDMVLPKVLEVDGVQSNSFPSIASLVHLRYLSLGLMKEEVSVFPLPISKLQNLQILILRCGNGIRIPDLIWDMVKLRRVDVSPEASFEIDSNRLQSSSILLENLRSLLKARVSCGDSKWLSKLFRLQRLSCVFVDDDYLDDYQFQMLSFNGQLTSLKVESASRWKEQSVSHIEWPSSLRRLTLSKFSLESDDMSAIGKALPNLEVFKIYGFHEIEWIVDDEDFPKLKVLKLRGLGISKWIVSEYSFPSLEHLWVENKYYFVDDSARAIEQLQHAKRNTEMRFSLATEPFHHVEPIKEDPYRLPSTSVVNTSQKNFPYRDPSSSVVDNMSQIFGRDDEKEIMSWVLDKEKNCWFGMSGEASGGDHGHSSSSIKGLATHGGRYVQYNVYGNLFEVSRKYDPPIRPVGRGAYGIVCAAVNSETREEVAIKKIGNAFDNRIDAKRTLREIKLLRHMEHDNIIAIKDIIRPPRKENFNDVYIVYELMDTDLHQIIKSNQQLTDDHCRYFLYQILRGLKYVHSANVLHRDLKPSNLLLNSNCDLKVADFGLARTTSETDFMTEYVVTRWYRAPELLLNCSEYTAAIDIWSVGCILGEIMTRQPLFPGKDYVHQLRLITELIGSPDDASLGFLRSDNARRYVKLLPQYPRQQFSSRFPNSSPGAIDLLEKMLVFDPSKRVTVDEALCHPYLAPLHDINEEPVCARPFSFDFEQPTCTEDNIKELIWRESVKFNLDPVH